MYKHEVKVAAYEAFDELRTIGFSHRESALACPWDYLWCFHLPVYIEFHASMLDDVEGLSGQPWWFSEAYISCFSPMWTNVQYGNTYLFDCRENMHRILVQVQICIDLISISISCCVVIMLSRERSGENVLIVSTSCRGFLTLSLRYCPDSL